MPYTRTGYEALVSQAVVQMLANCASARAASGAADATAAKDHIIEDWGGGETDARAVSGAILDQKTAWYVVRSLGMISDQIAIGTLVRSGKVLLVVNLPPVADDLPSDTVARGRDLASAIADEIYAQAGSPGCLASVVPEIGETVITAITGPTAGTTETNVTLSWNELP